MLEADISMYWLERRVRQTADIGVLITACEVTADDWRADVGCEPTCRELLVKHSSISFN